MCWIRLVMILFHPYGIVISGSAEIKSGVVIRQQVTIGNKGDDYNENISNNSSI